MLENTVSLQVPTPSSSWNQSPPSSLMLPGPRGVWRGGGYKCIDTYSLHFKQLRVSVLTSILHTKMLLSGGLRAALGYGVVMLLQ